MTVRVAMRTVRLDGQVSKAARVRVKATRKANVAPHKAQAAEDDQDPGEAEGRPSMKRFVVGRSAVALGAAAPAGAAERTDDTVKPVVFISGGETGAAVDCKAVWKPMQSQLREQRILADGQLHRFKTTPFATVSTHVGDTNCDWNVGVADSAGVETHAPRVGRLPEGEVRRARPSTRSRPGRAASCCAPRWRSSRRCASRTR